jgi:hypothetical protein
VIGICVALVGVTGVREVPAAETQGRSITYVGVTLDKPHLDKLGIGTSGFWFAQFDAATPVSGRPTGENAVDALPAWAGPLNHVAAITDVGCDIESLSHGCLPGYNFRTFSQDGPARSAGGFPSWDKLTLPDGRRGRSGAIVDPFTDGNTNNTVNRIQLGRGVPSSFLFHVVTDNTGLQHDPTNRIHARGSVGPLDANLQVDADRFPRAADLAFNGVPDVYTFRFDGFMPGDYIKVQLQGTAGSGGGSLAGFAFDEA